MTPRLSSPWPIRPVTEADWPAVRVLDENAFGATTPDDLAEAEHELHELDRSIGAFDGDLLVGYTTAYTMRLSVPGAVLPAAGVTWVGVLPTHRRRGVLRSLMTAQLTGLRDRAEEPIAVLWASEPGIYGRFGYGLASSRLEWTVPRSAQALHRDVPTDPGLHLRLVDPPDPAPLGAVHDGVAAQRPGVAERDERWWRRTLRDLPGLREGRSALRLVVAADDEQVRGYAIYATKQDFGEDFGSGVVAVREVMALDPAARAALYRYLFDLDLMGSTELWNLPVDDPLQHWLGDVRRAKPRLQDSLYVRLLDLPRALAARTYAQPVDVVLEVRDELCPDNAGRWRLAGGPGGATCEASDGEPDLVMSVRELGAAYLGGTPLTELAAAGWVREARPGTLAPTSVAFASALAPWNPQVF